MPSISKARRGQVFLLCGLMILSAACAGWMLSARPLDNHECFVSVTAREMLARDDWVMPTCNGEPRLQKTPLAYWLTAAIAKLAGRVDEFATRLPSSVFAFLSALAILYFVNRWLSYRVALIAAAVWATSLGYVRWSHCGRAEMALTFFVALCLLALYAAINTENRREQITFMLIFWISFALGNLAKGPAPVTYVFLPAALYVAFTKKWRVIGKLLPIWGILVCLVVVLPWPIAVAARMNWDVAIWKHEFFDRLFGEYAAGDYPWHYYFPMMFKYSFPWSVFLPIALAAPFYKVWGEKRPLMQFLWIWFAAGIVFLTLSGGKRQHYLLPLMPAMAILIAVCIDDMAFARSAFTPQFGGTILKVHAALFTAAALSPAGYFILAGSEKSALISTYFVISLCVILLTVTLTVAVLFAKNKPGLACAFAFCGLGILMAHHYTAWMDFSSPDRQDKALALEVRELVASTDELVAYKAVTPKFVHYADRIVPEIQAASELDSFCRQGCWIIAFGNDIRELAGNDGLTAVRNWQAPRAVLLRKQSP